MQNLESDMSASVLSQESLIHSTCVVTVTYDDRAHLLEYVLGTVLDMGVGKVVAVDNASTPESTRRLRYLAKRSERRVEVLHLDENLGSAGGFKAGLERAKALIEFEFIWLLDDDNVPKPDALECLWHAYCLLGGDPNNALLSLRRDLKEYVLAATRGEPVGFVSNAFLGFHIKDIPVKVWSRIKGFNPYKEPICFPLILVGHAPYGGFFFHRNWLDRIGFPDERLYLYGDDHEYSSRLIQAGGKIYLCTFSEVKDIDTSWNLQPVASRFWAVSKTEEQRIFFTIRNYVYREISDSKGSKTVFYANMVAYLSFVFFLGFLRGAGVKTLFKRACLIARAIHDGMKMKLNSVR
jgi:GT2 family glycosyltransferase